jgi:hypothetical protein
LLNVDDLKLFSMWMTLNGRVVEALSLRIRFKERLRLSESILVNFQKPVEATDENNLDNDHHRDTCDHSDLHCVGWLSQSERKTQLANSRQTQQTRQPRPECPLPAGPLLLVPLIEPVFLSQEGLKQMELLEF